MATNTAERTSDDIKYIAFCRWIDENLAPNELPLYLFKQAMEHNNAMVFHYLELTGDKWYSPETFIKAAGLILDDIDILNT